MKVRKLATGAALSAAIIAAGVIGGLTVTGGSSDQLSSGEKRNPSPVVMADGLELLSSATAEDWVSYGSAIVVVTVVAEQAGEVLDEDLEREEGTINRDVDLRVDERLWARPDVEVPDQITLGTTGWAWSDGKPDERVKFVNAGQSRYEVGEQYLMALAQWPGTPEEQLRTCEDEPEEGGWAPLGSYAIAPVTAGIVGVGEFEGSTRTLEDALEAANSPAEVFAVEGGSLRSHLYGKSVDAVAPALKLAAATAGPKKIPIPSC